MNPQAAFANGFISFGEFPLFPPNIMFVADTLSQDDTTLQFLATSTPRFKPEVSALAYEWLLPPSAQSGPFEISTGFRSGI